jgi:bifunctional oligoribonuclease and PAP phosphatase NrnA
MSHNLSSSTLDPDVPAEILEPLKKYNHFLIVSHISPDPDAVGSSMALARTLRELGKKADVYLQDGLPRRMFGLLNKEDILTEYSKNTPYEVLCVVDTSTRARMGKLHQEMLQTIPVIVNIDHHVSNEQFGHLNWIDDKVRSTAELVFLIAEALLPKVPEAVAELTLAGLHDDTGSFRFEGVETATFLRAARMMSCGVELSRIVSSIYDAIPPSTLLLQKEAFQTVKLLFDGKLSQIMVTQEMLTRSGANSEQASMMIDFIRSIDGVMVTLLIRQIEAGWKVSIRSKEPIDSNALAGIFGGGGHIRAAGCTLGGSFEDVERRLHEAVKKVLLVQ